MVGVPTAPTDGVNVDVDVDVAVGVDVDVAVGVIGEVVEEEDEDGKVDKGMRTSADAISSSLFS